MYCSSPQTAAASEADSHQLGIYSSSLAIRDAGGKGKGVFAAAAFARGEVVITGKPVCRSPHRTWQTLQIGVGVHVKIDVPFELVNHSCDPSCGIRPNVYGGYDLVAMRDVEAGEEVTFDYCMTEWTIVGFEACGCGSERCRGTVRGGKYLPPEKLEEYDGYTAPYYRSLRREVAAGPVGDEPSPLSELPVCAPA